MAVQDFECQIARAQIGRYLQGDVLSPEALDQLEDHIAGCPGCKSVLTDRRRALQEMLGWKGEELPKTAVVEEPPKPKGIQNKAVAQLQEALTSTKTADQKKPAIWKPLALSAALAVVLIGMSYLTKGNTSIMGSKVSEALPPAAKKVSDNEPEQAPELGVGDAAGLSPAMNVTPVETISDEVSPDQSAVELPNDTAAVAAAEEVKPIEVQQPPKTTVSTKADAPAKPIVKRSTPEVRVKKNLPRRPITRPAPPKQKSEPRINSIRVYDENGKPIR